MTLASRFNPFTGLPDFVGTGSATILAPLGFEATCETTSSVGDPVIIDAVTPNKVDSFATNVYTNLSVGIIQSKPTTTTCVVIIMGLLPGIASGLTPGRAVFISTTGGLTTTPPATGHQQIMGQAISATDIVVNVNNSKVIQI